MIEDHGHKLIIKYATEGCSILELGNQIMNLEDTQGVSAKRFYSEMGFAHTSIDQNGKDEALNLNLSSEIKDKRIDTYDLITDMGTTEHVEDLYNCLLNVYNACHEGTIIIHKNPKTGNFPNHGNHFFTLEFWKQYAWMVGYEVVELYEHPIYHNTKDGWECIAVLRYRGYTGTLIFPNRKKFNTIINHVKQS